ncbi:hypothetical protein NPIL_204591 [Nephila pilipes]|uniref:Uncharacterized protein n=1 Tax=Nephila pilipes TaxID=299642 RepID=A0A8X6NE72_NEPPI|nr:hypothetical protein NPIL_204591 [Nephila pilipes]
MASEIEYQPDHDMYSSPNSSRVSTPSIPENFHSICQQRKLIEQELKTYTDSKDHTQVLIKNLEIQGLQNYPIYTNHCAMIQGLLQQRLRLSVTFTLMRAANRSIAATHSIANPKASYHHHLLSEIFYCWFFIFPSHFSSSPIDGARFPGNFKPS